MSFEVSCRSDLDTALVKTAAVAYFKTHVFMYSKLMYSKKPYRKGSIYYFK
jgi:hypothetical protein